MKKRAKLMTKFDNTIFDLTDTSDLPEDLQGKLAQSNNDEKAEIWGDLVNAASKAGWKSMSINQIEAFARKAKMDIPSQATIRGYLNRAEELGVIHKPTRQTYSGGTAPAGTETEAEPAGEDADLLNDI